MEYNLKRTVEVLKFLKSCKVLKEPTNIVVSVVRNHQRLCFKNSGMKVFKDFVKLIRFFKSAEVFLKSLKRVEDTAFVLKI